MGANTALKVDHEVACTHDWQDSGRKQVHAFGAPAIYVRCAKCGQDGFRRHSSPVIYTWREK